MQITAYTITPHDAEMFRDLVTFLSEDVFDQRQRNGAIAKSDAFQRRISNARNVLNGIGAYEGENLQENHNG